MIETIVPRKSEDGIVFYVSADGQRTGISIRGLVRLLFEKEYGNLFVRERNQLLCDMVEGAERIDKPECLKDAWGKVFYPDLKGSDGADIISEEAAVAIIEHYAFDRNNEVARNSYRKFAKKGFSTWVKEVVNFASNPGMTEGILLQAVQQLMEEVKSIGAKVQRWDNLNGITATVYPGMKLLNDGLSQETKQNLLDNGELYSTNQWLQIKGIQLDRSTKSIFVRQASDTFLTMTGQRPPIKYKRQTKRDGSVKWIREGNGYRLVDFHILEAAFKSL